MPVLPAQSWRDIEPEAMTGDLLLFAGTSTESREIETFFESAYSHVGMVVRHGDDLWIWQTGPDPITRDPETGTSHGGAQLGVADATFEAMLGYGDAPFWRRLEVARDSGFEDRVVQAIGSFEGKAFPSMAAMVLHWAEGRAGIADPTDTMFCAELVARTYQEIGLLGDRPPANAYSPSSFSAESPTPALLMGATFAHEVAVSFP